SRAPRSRPESAHRQIFSTLAPRGGWWDRRAMALYTRRQLLVLLLLVAAGGGGLAVGHWRRANPDTVEYLEQLDRAPVPPPGVSAPQPSVRARAATSAADGEPRRGHRSRTARGAPRDPRRAHRSRPPRVAPAAPPAGTPIASSGDDLDADRTTDAASTSW